MKHLKNFNLFESNMILEGADIMSVSGIKIDFSNVEKDINQLIKDKIGDKAKKNFKKTTGLDFSTITKEITTFIKEQVKIINSTLFKKGLTDKEFQKMMNDLVSRVDSYVIKKTEELKDKMPFSIKTTLKVTPEALLKKEMLKQNGKDSDGLIEAFVILMGNSVINQNIVGEDKNKKIIDPDPIKFFISPNYQDSDGSVPKGYIIPKTYLEDKDGKDITPQTFGDRGNLFWIWMDENLFDGKKLVNHYIDLVVPILA